MAHLSATTPSDALDDRVVALLRTAVPTLWGTLVAALLTSAAGRLPAELGDALAAVLRSDVVIALVTVAAVAGWYAAWRWAEPHVPAWIVRLVLGSARTPSYAPVTADGAYVITTLPGEDVDLDALAGWPTPDDRH